MLSDSGSLVVEGIAGLLSNFNVVENAFSADGEATVVSRGAWQALGFDTSSFGTKPRKLFRSRNKDDYRLRKGSPAIDAGADALDGASAPPEDIDGVLRPQGTGLDLGAYERPDGGREAGA